MKYTDLLNLLYDKFYELNPGFKKPLDKATIIKSIEFVLNMDYKYWSMEDIKAAILQGVSGRWDRADNFKPYNVRMWLQGYDKDYRNKTKADQTYQHQKMRGGDYQPTEKDKERGAVAVVINSYLMDTGLMAHQKAGGFKEPRLEAYTIKVDKWNKEQLEKAVKFLKDFDRIEAPLGKYITELLKT